MAGELASAVALQSQPYNRPQSTGVSEGALDNAFNGRRRADEERKRKEDAARQKRLDETMKNTVFTKQYKNPYFNRQSDDVNAKGIEKLLQAYEDGENMSVASTKIINELMEAHKAFRSADDNMNAAREAHDKNPDSAAWYSLDGSVGGKPYLNQFDAINSGENDLLMPEVGRVFGSPGMSMSKITVDGQDIAIPYFSLAGASTSDGTIEALKMIKPEDYNVPNDPEELDFKGNKMAVFSKRISDEQAAKTAMTVMSNPTVGNRAVRDEYIRQRNEAAKKNIFLSPDEFIAKADIQGIQLKAASDLEAMLKAKKGDERQIQWQPEKAKAEKPSVYNVAPRTAYIAAQDKSSGKPMGYNIIAYNPQAGKNVSEVNVDLPAGHYEIVSGKVNKISNPNSLSAKPKGPAWLDGRLGFMYTNDSETYFNPLDQGSYQMWLQHTDVPEEDVLKEIQQLGSGNKAITDANRAWMEKMGLQKTTPSGSAKAPSAAPASGTINLQDLPVGAKIEVRNGKNYYNGKEIKM